MKEKKAKTSYFKNVLSTYSVWKIIQITLMIIVCVGFIDWKDIPSKTFMNSFAIGAGIVFGMILLVTLKKVYLEELLRIVAVNVIDLWLCVGCAFSITYFLFCVFLNILALYKIIILCFILLGGGVALLIRKKQYEKADTRANNYTGNTIDLMDLFLGKNNSIDGMFLLDEKEVDYDLLDRKTVITHLYNVLCECKPQKRFVISLEGKWGVGKSTILRNVKRMLQTQQNDVVVIDSFDPWTYGTEESIVENFFCCLLNNSDLRINTLEMRKSISVLSKAVIGSTEKSDWFEKIVLKEKTVEESKKQINEYLRLCGKKIVIFIDNLDRVNDEKIFFLFKLIGNVLDFDRVIFVVSFDPEVVRRIFEEQSNIGYDYLEKIIQMQIRVPEYDKDVLRNVVRVCTENLLKNYVLNEEEVEDYKDFIESICDSLKDIRDFKRVFNSVVVKVLSNKSSLSKRDLLVIEYIKMRNLQLYQTLYKKRMYFISEGVLYDREIYMSRFQKEEHEKKAKVFLEQLFEAEENRQYQKILAKVFPYVNRFCDNLRYQNVETLTPDQIEKSRGIASAKYFELYFSETENELSILGGEIEKYIKNINSSAKDVERGLASVLSLLGPAFHREMLEAIQLYIPEINKNVLYNLCIGLIEVYWELDDSSMFLVLNARQRCTVLIWEILRVLEESEFRDILQYLVTAYDRLGMINEVIYWFEKNKEDEGRHEELKKLENKLVKDILENKINLYYNQYYHPKNVLGMCRNMKDNEKVFKEYIKENCTESTIFKMLYDIMGYSHGGGYRYYFKSSAIKMFFDEDELREFMNRVVPKTDDEKFVLDVYNEYVLNPDDEYPDENGVFSPKEIKLKLD